ncbi:MAG: PQQ-binding-like beta-propeller repeat protein [Planctomycetes bacterium]|nr:PQQ-binding-like beta-propeller repeat protein [Planctomycetota bacterium]
MNKLIFPILIPAITAVVGLVFLTLWVYADTPLENEIRVPDETRVTVVDENAEPIAELTNLIVSDGSPADIPGEWSQFRGTNYDNISVDDTVTLAREWPRSGPPVIWSLEMGEGYAGAAVRNGRVFVLDYDRDQQLDSLRCFSMDDGEEIWRFTYPVKIKRNHGMSRTVPTVTDEYVVTLGPKCHVACLDPNTGELHWMLDLVKDFKTKVPLWYAGQCPVIDGDNVIIAPGGDPLMMAVNLATGEIVWQTPNEHDWKMTHVSIVPMEFAGKNMYVYCGHRGVAGVSADDGSILWESTDWFIRSATVPTPVIIDDGRIFFTGGYEAGSVMMQLKETDTGKIEAEVLYRLPVETFGAEQQTPIYYNGYLYGIGQHDDQLSCLDLDGNFVWQSGSATTFHLGPFMIANGLIYVMDDSGLLTLAEATPSDYRQLAQAQVLHGHDSWGPMAMVSGRLIVRDMTQMVCLDVTER